MLIRTLILLLFAAQFIPAVSAVAQEQPSSAFEEEFWNGVKDSGRPAAIVDYLWLFPNGRFVGEANAEIERLRMGKGQIITDRPQVDRDRSRSAETSTTAGSRERSGLEAQGPETSEPEAPPKKLITFPAPVEVLPTCSERLGALGAAESGILCMTVLTTGNFTFTRDCQPMSFGFAGVSVPDEVFFRANETLLLEDRDGSTLQPTGGRPNCYLLVGDKPEKLRRYRYVMVEPGEKGARICDASGECF